MYSWTCQRLSPHGRRYRAGAQSFKATAPLAVHARVALTYACRKRTAMHGASESLRRRSLPPRAAAAAAAPRGVPARRLLVAAGGARARAHRRAGSKSPRTYGTCCDPPYTLLRYFYIRRWPEQCASMPTHYSRPAASHRSVSDFILRRCRSSLLGVVENLPHELLPVHQLLKAKLIQVVITASAAAAAVWLGKASLGSAY